ncbi:peptidoglycan D,D-transpeptidase FtsI family protein [Paenibacillus chartarius]|uniref:Peptidoglycan D,D-transpeptidase FtsI family protein n=1 Tax=Paenibacillus chartarius TaxID=747481 RepID=A0ABV6DP78_9BACL
MRRVVTEDSAKREAEERRHFSFRINGFFFVIFVLFSVLIVRLAVLQFVEGKELIAKENETNNADTPIAPIRGNIYDVNGYPLAYTTSVQSLYFRVEVGQKKEEIVALARKLADIFKTFGDPAKQQPTAEEIVLKMDVGYDINLNDVRDPSYYNIPRKIKSQLNEKEIAYIAEHRDELPWIEVTEESIRRYSNEPVIAAQLVGYLRPFNTARGSNGLEFYKNKSNTEGYLDSESVGFDGIEQMYQTELRGKNGKKTYPVDVLGRITGRVTLTPPEKGNNLHLTIHKDVQLQTQQAIEDQLNWLHSAEARSNPYARYGQNAKAGYAVAMEVDTGRVVAMASYPDYDPNIWINGFTTEEYKTYLQFRVNNGTITAASPEYHTDEELRKHPNSIVFMGSTIKPLSVLIGLNEGLFGLFEEYYDTGKYSFGKAGSQSTISNSDNHAYGSINGAEAIRYSSNTFMSEMIGNRLYFNKKDGLNIFANYLRKFGIGVTTGSGLPREYGGDRQLEFFANAKTDSPQSALIYASWGQNEKITTLQLAQYGVALANKGKRIKPLFVDKITTYDGQLIKKPETEVLDETKFPDSYWQQIYKGMSEVGVQGFDGFPYAFGRKTGTSTQDASGGRVENAVFVAFAPLDKPKLAVAVIVPEGGFGSWGAAPIARKIFDAYDQYIGLNGVPKGAPAGAAAAGAAVPAGSTAPAAPNRQ